MKGLFTEGAAVSAFYTLKITYMTLFKTVLGYKDTGSLKQEGFAIVQGSENKDLQMQLYL